MGRPTDEEIEYERRNSEIDAAERQAKALERIADALEKIVDLHEKRPKAGWQPG